MKAAAVALDAKPGSSTASATATGGPASDPVLKYLTVGRQLGYAFYLSFDMVTYFDAAGIRKIAAIKRWQAQAAKAWFAGLICSAMAGLYSLWKLNEMQKTVNKKDGEGAVEGKKIEKFVFPLSVLFFSLSLRY